MYTSIEIKGFRCFKHLKIDKLARINLIGGKNNTGKTALLEALAIAASGGTQPGSLVHRLYQCRGLPDAAMVALGFSDLFTDFQEDGEAHIHLRDLKGSETDTVLRAETETSAVPSGLMESQSDTLAIRPLGTAAPFPSMAALALPRRLDIHADGRRGALHIVSDSRLMSFWNHATPATASWLVPSRWALDQAALATTFGDLQVSRRKSDVLAALRHLEPALRDLELVYAYHEPVIHADVGGPRLVPLAILGEGLVRATSLMIVIAWLRNGVLLVDEIENGLHYSVMPDVWRAVAHAAADLDVQVFATTHSHECVEAAYEATEGMPGDTFLYHRLDRVGDDVECRTYEGRGLEIAIKTGTEFR